ncbi:MAG: ABC transporter ATP-binding protein [Acidipropionibacterium sp.]|jgi:branched-chain amino acid transport system ATP-binding protein|nr:ABC transporter ATP-binding protein [Acidipropionibacterium sp.]
MAETSQTPQGVVTPAALAAEEAAPGCKKVDPILSASDITREFGGLKAVDVEHLEIPRGAITALIGPNGAGKTTLFNLLTGFDTPNSGTWSFDGTSLAGIPAHKVSLMGEVRTFQLTKVLGRMTVLESMKLGARHQRGEHFWAALLPFIWSSEEKANEKRALELLDRFGLLAKKDDFAGSMSGGQRKLLEMARALMCDPQLVMLDEPMAGVNPALKQSLLGHIVGLKESGVTVLFVEHDMHMVHTIADWVVVMAEGKVVAEGTPDVVMEDPAVVDAYLGSNKDRDLGEVIDGIRSNRKKTIDLSDVDIHRDEAVLEAQQEALETAQELGETDDPEALAEKIIAADAGGADQGDGADERKDQA